MSNSMNGPSTNGPSMHSKEHELLLEAALAGDVDPQDPRWLERISSCSECSENFRELTELRELLDDAGRDERSILASIDPRRDVPGSDRVAPTVHAVLAQRRARWSLGRRALVWTASAAAGVMAVGGIVRWLMPHANPEHHESMLGEAEEAGMSPSGSVPDFDEFRWTVELPPGGEFELVVWSDEPGDEGRLLARISHLDDQRWTPAIEQKRAWPNTIRWELRVVDVSDQQIAAPTARAERSPR
jgi:hypothetical protein